MLTLVLPDSRTGLPELEKKMDENFFANVRGKIKWSNHVFTAKIPKFKINCRVDLVSVLKSMGVKTMFDAKADFQGYFRQNGKGHYSRVFQQCALEVSEKGSEGGAAPTGVKLQTGDIKFNANHPFLFFVTDEKNEAVIMVGCKIQF
jgi:serine protease inhibitor